MIHDLAEIEFVGP